MKKNLKKYRCIAKVGPSEFVKYNVNDLLKFTHFLDEAFPAWRWFNVYEYDKEGNGPQLSSFTSKKRPAFRYLPV